MPMLPLAQTHGLYLPVGTIIVLAIIVALVIWFMPRGPRY